MKFISLVIGILPYLVLAQIKTRHQPISGNLVQTSNTSYYYPSSGNGWNPASVLYHQESGHTAYPVNYNTQPMPAGTGWNSSNSNSYQSENVQSVTTYPGQNYNTQSVPGNIWNSSDSYYQPKYVQNVTPYPGQSYNTQPVPATVLAPFNYNTQQQQQVPGNRWNSSNSNYQPGSVQNVTPYPGQNYNTQPVPANSWNSPSTMLPASNFNGQQQQQVLGNIWNSSSSNYQPRYVENVTPYPGQNYNTQHSSGHGWNSSNLHHQSGNRSPTTMLAPFNSYTQQQQMSGNGWNSSNSNYQPKYVQNVTPYPGQNYNTQPVSANGWNSPATLLAPFNSNTQQQQQMSGNGWNSSPSSHRQLAPLSALPGLNSNRHTIPTKPVFIDKTAEFLNITRSKIASGICFTDVPTATLVAIHNAIPSGNGSNPTMSRIQICCEGYERNPHIFRKCDPICKDECPNGICTAPNTCVCLPGNVRDYEGNCVPTCPIGCRNGNCKSDGSCVCKPGYILDPISKQFCTPHCTRGCNFGKCVAPETCRCSPNYELSASGDCQPKCDNCDGTCTAPGVCMCNRGYIRKGSICEPICTKGCNKGTCAAPETCVCKPGFVLDSTKANCMPHCDKPCLNGFCDGFNVCSCKPGYILDSTQPNVCKAHCPSGCPNGTCSAPNFCLCNAGYMKSGVKGRQSCVPK